MTPTRQAQLPRFDEQMRQAKNAHKEVRLVLGGDCEPYTDDACAVYGEIKEVDKFMLGIDIEGVGLVWFSKSAIVAARIQP